MKVFMEDCKPGSEGMIYYEEFYRAASKLLLLGHDFTAPFSIITEALNQIDRKLERAIEDYERNLLHGMQDVLVENVKELAPKLVPVAAAAVRKYVAENEDIQLEILKLKLEYAEAAEKLAVTKAKVFDFLTVC